MTSEPLLTQGEKSVDRRAGNFSRTWTDTLAFPRSFTETALSMLDYENEEAVLRKVVDDYKNVAAKGPEGDVPIPEGFGGRLMFWKVVTISCCIAAFMGVAAVGVINCANSIPKIWIDNGNFDEITDFDYYAGSKVWILVTTLTGLVVGIIRWITSYPEDLPGFFKEVNECHVDPKHVPVTVTISAISLAGGACLGPEACLGNFSGGLGTFISERIEFEHEEDRKLFVLSSMSAALGCLFPSPFQAVLMIIELCAKLPKPFMETVSACTLPAMVGFSVYFSLSELAYLPHLEASYRFSEEWEFELHHILYGIVIGIISGCLCLVQLITVGVFKQLFIRIRQRCDATGVISGTIVAPVLGGLILGTERRYSFVLTVILLPSPILHLYIYQG